MLGPGGTIELNFILLPAAPSLAATADAPAPSGWLAHLGAPLPNPVVTSLAGRVVTLRALGVAIAVLGALLAVLVFFVLGPRLGVRRQRLSDAEVAELVFNAGKSLQERVSPVVHGAAGFSWSISYGADEIRAMIEARRYGLLVTSLLAPVFVAVAVIGFALALLVGQPLYLLLGMAVVPLGFVIVPAIITWQALRARRRPRPDPYPNRPQPSRRQPGRGDERQI